MRPPIALAFVALAAIGFAVFALGTGGTALAKDNPVNIGVLFFCDSSKINQVCETDVTAGDSVTWTVSSSSHTVTQCTDDTFATCSGGFDSGTLQQTESYSRTFDTPGAIFYHCAFHPGQMKGKIVVAAAETPSPSPSPTPSPPLPNTGGAPGDGGSMAWLYGLLALSGALIAGSGLSFAFVRRR